MARFISFALAFAPTALANGGNFTDFSSKVAQRLQETCGDECVVAWNDKISPMVEKLQMKAKERHEDAIPLAVAQSIGDFNTMFKKDKEMLLRKVEGTSKKIALIAETPVSGKSIRDIQEAKNRCTMVRQAAMEAYDGSRIIVNAMASSVAVLCGCIFTPVKAECAMSGNPYTCGFPSRAYESLYYTSETLWEAVKLTTNLCRIN